MSAIHPVTIPKWGIEMQEGTVTEWRVAEGEAVEKGAELIDIESDKIVNTMEAPASGVLHRVLAEVDSTLKVGQLLGVIAPADVSAADIDSFIEAFVPADAGFGIDDDESPSAEPASAEVVENVTQATPAAPSPSGTVKEAGGEVKVSPVARRLAARLGVDLTQVVGTGRNGRISTADVEAAAAAPSDASASGDNSMESTIKLSSRELTAARRLVASKQEIPHFYLQRDLDMRHALAAKDRDGVPLTALLLKAIAQALEAHPRINAHLDGDKLKPQTGVALNVAVDTPEGLVAPLLPGLNELSVGDIASALRALAERAREKSLGASDLAAGGLTLSNLGMFGITEFTAIINPPQVAILAVGTLRPLQLESDEAPVPAMTATLSCDHRAIDGAAGARFLATLQESLNTL